jgi:hypothetical protein
MNKYLLLNYLNCRRLLLSQDESVSGLYHTLCDVSPEFYVHLLAEVASDATRKRETLILLLQSPVVNGVGGIGRRSLRSSLCRAHSRRSLGEMRNSHSDAHQRLLSSLDGYGISPQMAAIRKQYVMRLLKHALGKDICPAMSCYSPARETPEAGSNSQKQHESFAWYGTGRYRAGA